MKKLLLIPTLLLAINLGATTAEQIKEVTQATTDKKNISFLVRHANKLKKFAYATDVILPVALVLYVGAGKIYVNADAGTTTELVADYIEDASLYAAIAAFLCKIITDPASKYAMSKKQTYDLEELKNAQ